MSMFFVHNACAAHIAPPPVSSLSTRDVETVIVSGTSIENHASSREVRDFVQGFIKNKYGLEITIINRAVSGSQINDLVRLPTEAGAQSDETDWITSQVAEYANLQNVTFMLNHGFNDANGGPFLSKGTEVQQQLIADWKYVVEFARNHGWHVVMGASTASWGGSEDFTNPDPATPVDDKGTYDYERDLKVPIAQEYIPAYVQNDEYGVPWLASDSYNRTRNFTNAYRDILDQTDFTHSGMWFRAMHLKTMIETAVLTSLGQLPNPVTKRDYNTTYPKASATDMVFGFNRDVNVATSNANINWVTVDNDNFTGDLFLDSVIKTDGAAASGVKLYTYVDVVDKSGLGNQSNPTDDTASLTNNALLSGALGNGKGYYTRTFYVLVEGLEPFRRYEMSVAASNSANKSRISYYFLHDGNATEDIITIDPTAANPESNIVTREFLSDSDGFAILAARFDSADGNNINEQVVSGLRIASTGEAQVNQPPTANAGPDQSIAAGATCILEGTASSDSDGTIISYSWRKVSGPTIALANANQAVASFIAPSEATIQTLVFELTVTDDDGVTSAPDTVNVTVAAVPDVADPLDPTLSVISIKSKAGIEDDAQSFGVVSLYQYTDNFILCEVVSKTNTALTPSSFSQAEYRIVDAKGANVVKLGLGTGIKEADGKFLIHINSGILNSNHKGSLKHQFVVWNQAGYKLPPIFGGTVNIIPVLEPTL